MSRKGRIRYNHLSPSPLIIPGAVEVVKLSVTNGSSFACIQSMIYLELKPIVRSLPLRPMVTFSLISPSSLWAEGQAFTHTQYVRTKAVLSVVPRYAVTVGSLKARRGGTVIGKTLEERGNCI